MVEKRHRYICQYIYRQLKKKGSDPEPYLEFTETITAAYEFSTTSTNLSKSTQKKILDMAMVGKSENASDAYIASISYMGYMTDEEYNS